MTPAPSTNPPKRKVLIVDDEPGMARLMAFILSTGGYHAEAAIGGEAGWSRFQAEPWDLVLTDWTMDRMSGSELSERIEEKAPGTPIIMATGRPQAVTNPQRFSAIMPKPFGRTDLLNAVGLALKQTPEAVSTPA